MQAKRQRTKTVGAVGAVLALLGLSSACQGLISDPTGSGAGTAPSDATLQPDGSFTCVPEARPSATELRRLTGTEYRNALEDLFAELTIDAAAIARDALLRLPTDGIEGEYTRMDSRLGPDHVRSYFDVGVALAEAVAESATFTAAVFGGCDDVASSPACIDAFLDGFATRAHRIPLSVEERTRYHALADGTRTGTELAHALLLTALMSPQFLYHLETEGQALDGDDDHFALDAYHLAARLSFHFWRTIPDEALFEAAADGSLLTPEGYAREVERVFDDSRTQVSMAHFYREWLSYDAVGDFPDTPVFNAFADGEGIHEAGAAHLEAMRVEVDALIAHHTWAEPGDLRDLLLTDVSVTRSPELARLYGVDVWDGSAAHPRFAPGERPGLLTRAAFLVNGEHQTNPIHRGAVLRQRILCDTLALPDPADLPEGALDPPEFTPEMSTRERWEEKTANEPCASCHASINPLGFVLERYDALGRFRVTEEILDGRTGEPVAEHSIDTRATVSVGGVVVELDEPRALMELVADNGKTESCFARQYFRYTHARRETAADGCALESVRSSLVGSESVGTLREALRAIALSPSFKSRVVGEE